MDYSCRRATYCFMEWNRNKFHLLEGMPFVLLREGSVLKGPIDVTIKVGGVLVDLFKDLFYSGWDIFV